jgi:hypothetical protein
MTGVAGLPSLHPPLRGTFSRISGGRDTHK